MHLLLFRQQPCANYHKHERLGYRACDNVQIYIYYPSRGTKGCEDMTEKTFTFTNERMPSENLVDGRQVVKVTPGGTKILANIVDGKITYYEAEDNTGNQRS